MARSDPSTRSRLTRAGFYDVEKSERFYSALLSEPAIGDVDVNEFARAASPDDALLGLLRLAEAVRTDGRDDGVGELAAAWTDDPELVRRLITTLGASTGLVDHVVRHPADWRLLAGDEGTLLLGRPGCTPAQLRTALLDAVGADPAADVPVAAGGGEEQWTALRGRYRQLLLQLVADDSASLQPTAIVPEVARILADMAAAALEASLAVARAAIGPEHAKVRLAVIGMGKTGGRELNYVSDVDVIYVVEPAGPPGSADDDEVREIGTHLATQLAAACAAPSTEPALWAVDAALRPEGKNGQLVRTLDEHRHYYDHWAKSWEFQALLKARPVAGDAELGQAYYEALNPLVWEASRRDGFVDSVRAMRTRVTDNIPDRDVPQQLKLGPGGLRDVEFSAQLLQMVHGSADESLRAPNTWDALEALKAGGYIGRDDGAELDAGYRFLRVIEHRLQMSRLRRTHLVPTDPHALRSLARGVYPIGSESRTGDRLEASRKELARRIRVLHQRIFYRPVLAASAHLTGDEATLTTSEAAGRLAAVGYADPKGALRHIQALSSGVSRRAAIQRQLLPVLLEWLSNGVDPDAALLGFRKVSESLGTSHWYLRLLRDSGVAAERLTTLLGVSRKITELLLDRPAAVAWLDDPKALRAADRHSIAAEGDRTAARHATVDDAIGAVRSIYTRELLRVAIRDALALGEPNDVTVELSMIAEASIATALTTVRRFAGDPPSAGFRFTVVAMGRLGGAEVGYDSDADVIFVYDPGGADAAAAAEYANRLAGDLIAALRAPTGNAAIALDAALRPEGKNGPLTGRSNRMRTITGNGHSRGRRRHYCAHEPSPVTSTWAPNTKC